MSSTRQQENQKQQVEPENDEPAAWYGTRIRIYRLIWKKRQRRLLQKVYGVEIQTELVSEVDYMENISEKSMAEEHDRAGSLCGSYIPAWKSSAGWS